MEVVSHYLETLNNMLRKGIDIRLRWRNVNRLSERF